MPRLNLSQSEQQPDNSFTWGNLWDRPLDPEEKPR
jgi:alkanesulfonate monooxygenase